MIVAARPAESYVYSINNKKLISAYQQAEQLLQEEKYEEATTILHEAVKKEPRFVEAHYLLAYLYYQLGKFPLSKRLLRTAVKALPEGKPLTALHYRAAELYYRLGNYRKAQKLLDTAWYYATQTPFPPDLKDRAATLQKDLAFAHQALEHILPLRPVPLPKPLNKFVAQYFPVLTVDQQTLLFTARLGRKLASQENIYISYKNAQGDWTPPVSVSEHINSGKKEGACTISADGKTLIFSAYHRKGNYGVCDLYVSYKKKGVWTIPQNLGPHVNTPGWQSQPSLSADGKTLYFASNRKGNYGKKDIWKTTLDENGQWTAPVNLGPIINGKGRQVSPFIHANGQTLYFASDRHPSLGGLDLYYSHYRDGQWTEPANLGYPINDHKDQVSLFITADGSKGYYADGQQQGSHYYASKLYVFDVPKDFAPVPLTGYIKGQVLTAIGQIPLDATVTIYDVETRQKQIVVQTDEYDGQFCIALNGGKVYDIYIDKEGYLFETLHVNYKSDPTPVKKSETIVLRPLALGMSWSLYPILFDVDRYTLTLGAHTALDFMATFLKKNPTIYVAIAGHTDSDGHSAYNETLSKERAKAVCDFLEKSGISPQRMTCIGYGARLPIAPNDTPEGKQKNRRVMFHITQIEGATLPLQENS